MVNKNLLLVCFGFILISLMGVGSATVQASFDAYYSVIENDGSFSDTTTPVVGLAVDRYTCADVDCTSVDSNVPDEITYSFSSNVVIDFPTELESPGHGYLLYFYSDGYIGMARSGITLHGNGSVSSDVYLSRKASGYAPIMNVDVVNEIATNRMIEVGVDVGIDADTYAAIEDSRQSDFPLRESIETLVTLEIIDSNGVVVYTDSETLDIEYSGVEAVSFSYAGFDVGEEGEYEFVLYTEFTDGRILNPVRQRSSGNILTVLEENATDYWYTLISGLSWSPVVPEIDELVTFDFTYSSAYIDGAVNIYVDTEVEVEFFKDSSSMSVDSYTLDSDLDEFSFNNTFTQIGNYTVAVRGSPVGALAGDDVYSFSQNISFVIGEPVSISCYSDLNCGTEYTAGGSNYCSSGDVYHDFIYPSCVNPGASDSYCSFDNVLPWAVQTCSDGCSSGSCSVAVDNDLDNDGYNNSIDCNDGNSSVWQNLTGYVDADGDGFGSGASVVVCSGVNLSSEYAVSGGDCDDTDPSVNVDCSGGSVGGDDDDDDDDCNSRWECSLWSDCDDGTEERICVDTRGCSNVRNNPIEIRSCSTIGLSGISGSVIGFDGLSSAEESNASFWWIFFLCLLISLTLLLVVLLYLRNR